MFGWFKKKSGSYSLEKLASEVIEISQKHYPDDQFNYDKKMNEVISVSGDSPKTFLGNIFNVVKDMSTEDRNAYLEDFFETVKHTSDELTLETLKSFLFMRVRTSAELGLRDLVLSPRMEDKEFFTVGIGQLFFDLTVDYGSSLSTPPKSDLINAGGGSETVLDMALQNLKAISKGTHWEEVCPHIWYSTYEDDYDAARLVCLYPEYDLPDGVNNPIAYMPSHSDCLITDKDDPETLALMVQKGDEWAANSRNLSKTLWQNKKSGWEPVKLSKSHPSFAFTENQKRMEDSTFYNEQKELLENKFLNENQDIFIASVLLYEDKDKGLTFSCSVLSFGIETLLPKTERVAFVDPERPDEEQFLGMLEWDEFVNLIGQEKLSPFKSLNPIRYDFRTNLDKTDFNNITQRLSRAE